jgi:hypothetical protein
VWLFPARLTGAPPLGLLFTETNKVAPLGDIGKTM